MGADLDLDGSGLLQNGGGVCEGVVNVDNYNDGGGQRAARGWISAERCALSP